MSTGPHARRARPGRRPRRRAGLAGLATAVVLALVAGCGPAPALPDAVPSPGDLVPSFASQRPPDGAQHLGTGATETVRRMAVRIRNVQCDGLSTGSGFALDAHTLVTNKHVVEDSRSLQVATSDGRDVAVASASVAKVADLAVVRTSEALPSSPTLADADPAEGDDVTVVGYPEGGKLTVTRGTVVGTTDDPLYSTLGKVLVTDASVEPGSSGSAALDDDGRVIGVVYAKTDDGRSLLVPVSTLRSLLDDTAAFTAAPSCAG
ncbi:S1C family serine protease [Cellulomonas sp. PhB143]|uniref:S1C family serine protease n=1 Tax=Cellulomonas sp. PhB143 TaxID=2485186 RepID=UPI000F48E2E6|nr:serine protease [Cellulomonas sp. PhB143]ROS77239.1 trypsin-like peptidase [Cellulomonas sp. PhB143]